VGIRSHAMGERSHVMGERSHWSALRGFPGVPDTLLGLWRPVLGLSGSWV
jgi:hypothetical protein